MGKERFKERTEYVISEGYYIGSMVNLPIIVQAKSLEDLKRRIKIITITYIAELQKTVDNDDFEFVQVETFINNKK